jgi:hypothetical protein
LPIKKGEIKVRYERPVTFYDIDLRGAEMTVEPAQSSRTRRVLRFIGIPFRKPTAGIWPFSASPRFCLWVAGAAAWVTIGQTAVAVVQILVTK